MDRNGFKPTCVYNIQSIRPSNCSRQDYVFSYRTEGRTTVGIKRLCVGNSFKILQSINISLRQMFMFYYMVDESKYDTDKVQGVMYASKYHSSAQVRVCPSKGCVSHI